MAATAKLPGGTAPEVNARQGAHVVEMQRRRLLSAIVEVLGEHGYEGATVGRICKRAGVSRRTFYDLYDDREGCFLDAFEHAIERLSGLVVPAYAGEQRWRERVRGALTVLLECFDAEPGVARLCFVETLKGGPEVLARRRAITDALAAAIDAGRTEAKGADPPPLTAESLVGGAISVIHARLAGSAAPATQDPGVGAASPPAGASAPPTGAHERLLGLLNPLMSMIVLPYLGQTAARKELDRPVPRPSAAPMGSNGHVPVPASDPFRGLPIRITFRTVRVLGTIGAQADASNREIGQHAGVTDQGQMSKLLRRLEKAGLIENHGLGQVRGEANAWRLTAQGQGVLHAVGGDGDT
jgi:AcrR family transcriptional regulator